MFTKDGKIVYETRPCWLCNGTRVVDHIGVFTNNNHNGKAYGPSGEIKDVEGMIMSTYYEDCIVQVDADTWYCVIDDIAMTLDEAYEYVYPILGDDTDQYIQSLDVCALNK